MLKKKKIKQNINIIIILSFLLMILLIKIDFFRQIYFLSENNYNKRMVKNHGYCGKDSYGFLLTLKEKFKFIKNPRILNSDVIPPSDWIIYDSNKNFQKKPNIFLNYQKNPSLIFSPSNSNFKSKGRVQFTNMLDSITFKINDKNLNLKNNINIFKIRNGERKIIFNKYFDKKINDSENINISFKTEEFNARWDPIYIEIENFDYNKNKISSISLNFKNKYQFNTNDILFSEGNCYYIK
jgi:hypothetical protein